MVSDAPGRSVLLHRAGHQGDRLNTDIEGAALLGLRTALVLTGVSTLADVEGSEHKPDGVYAGLVDLAEAFAR